MAGGVGFPGYHPAQAGGRSPQDPELIALLEALAQMSGGGGGRRQPPPSPLSFLPALSAPTVPQSGVGIGPEELAALAASKPGAAGQVDPWSAMAAGTKQLTEDGKDGEPSALKSLMQVFSEISKGSAEHAAQQGGAAQESQLALDARNPPPVTAMPLPAPAEMGPAVPSGLDYFRQGNREQFGMPGGKPPSGPALPGTTVGPYPASQDPMQSDAYPRDTDPLMQLLTGLGRQLSPVETGEQRPFTKPGMDFVGPPIPTVQQEAIQGTKDWFWGTPLGQVFSGDPIGGAKRALDNTSKWGGEGGDTSGTSEAAPAVDGPAKPFRYSYPGATPSAQQTPGWNETTIDTKTGTVTSGKAQATAPKREDVIAEYMPSMVSAESGGKMVPNAAGASSAFGPAQFTDGTWIDTVRKHMPETKGMPTADILNLRTDPEIHNKMARAFTEDNADILDANKVPITKGSLYTMHFFGNGDGPKVLAAPDNTPIEKVVSAASIKANPHLAGMTVGQAKAWAESTINKTSGQGNGYGMPARTPRDVEQYPAPPMREMPVGVDYTKVIEEMRKSGPKKAEPLGGLDQLIAVLGGMASGAAGAPGSDWGRVIAGAGGGAAQGAGNIAAIERGDQKAYNEGLSRLAARMAGTYENEATSKANTTNAGKDTKFANQRSTYETAVKNSQLKAAERSAVAEYQDKVNWKAWEAGQPQVAANEKGISIITRTPDGKINLKTQQYNDFDKELKRIQEMEEALGKDDTSVVMAKTAAANTRGGELGVRRMMLADAVEGNMLRQILGSEYEKMDKAIQKDLPVALKAEPKEYKKAYDARAIDVLMTKMREGQLPDTWIEALAKAGHPAALMMVQNAQKSAGGQGAKNPSQPGQNPGPQSSLDDAVNPVSLPGQFAGGGGDYKDTRQFMKNAQPDEVLPYGSDTSGYSQEEYNLRYDGKGEGVSAYKRVFDKEGYDQMGKNKEGYSREDRATPAIDYSEITATKGKPIKPFAGVKVHEDDQGKKVVEIFENKGDSLEALQAQAVKDGKMQPGDKVLVRDAKGNTFWYTYTPNDPGGMADGADPETDPVKYKFNIWTPPTPFISQTDDFFGPKVG